MDGTEEVYRPGARRAPEASAAEVCAVRRRSLTRPPLSAPHRLRRPCSRVRVHAVRTHANRPAFEHKETPAAGGNHRRPQGANRKEPKLQAGKSCARRDSNPQPSDP